MKRDTVVSLCDETGLFTRDWRDAGYRAIHVDPLRDFNGTILEMIPSIRLAIEGGRVAFVAGFPPCTDVAVTGARHFARKRKVDPHFQGKAALIAEQCRMVGELSGAPWFFENPKSVFSSIFGPPDFSFQPHEYGGYLPADDVHPTWPKYIAPRDAYPKDTNLWAGGGFELPEKKPVEPEPGYSRQFRLLGGNSQRTKTIRSATPRGFARAIFERYANDN